jgi:hypothetical protein
MQSSDASIRDGRNPAWRIAWNGLDEEARERIRAAFRTGTRLEDPALEPFAQGFLARAERGHRWFPYQFAATTLLIGVWLFATAVLRPSEWAAFYTVLLLIDLICLPVVHRRSSRRLAKAQHAQHPAG